MEPHLIREETELFPAIANSEAKEHCQALVYILEEEHEAAGTLLKKLRHATNDYSVPCDGCDTFVNCTRNLLKSKKIPCSTTTLKTTSSSRKFLRSPLES